MTTNAMTCANFDERLADYLEGDVAPVEHEKLAAHVASCVRCTSLVRDLETIRAEARALPELAPTRDLWDAIAARIEAPVIPLAAASAAAAPNVFARRPWSEHVKLAAVAAALVAVTAGVTYTVTASRTGGSARAIAVADTARPSAPDTSNRSDTTSTVVADPNRRLAGVDPSTEPDSQANEPDAAPPAAQSVRNSSPGVTYSREIDRLRTIFRENRSQLDPRTAAIIEANLKVIDDAITQSKAALAQDPASRFLNNQLNSALGKKLELLRTAARLPSRT